MNTKRHKPLYMRILALMKRRDMTRLEVSQALGVNYNWVNNVLNVKDGHKQEATIRAGINLLRLEAEDHV